MDVLFLIIGIVSGVVIGWIVSRLFINKTLQDGSELHAELQEKQVLLQVELEKRSNLEYQLNELKKELAEQREKVVLLNSDLSAKKEAFSNLKERLDNQTQEVEGMQQQFTEQFKNLANSILEEKSKRFTEQNQANINQVLKPLNEKLKDFEKKVEDTYVKNVKDRTDLQAEVKKLYELNARISEDANNLTRALKGDVKKQGNWGEMVLERILENSGLEKGREYKTQESFSREDGGRYQPDVIVYLPENKHIVIDAKVSLVAYENYVSSDSKEEQLAFMKDHLRSIKAHIKELSNKQYYKLDGLNTPEYVLMFIPIEASFSIAVKEDNALFNEAWENKIVIVSPSTLIATLMTVSSIWNQENQTKNAIEIARQSGNLYDKFEGLLKDLQQLGKKLDDAQTFYGNTISKLSTGKGNLINRVENLKALGAKASKSISNDLIEKASENK